MANGHTMPSHGALFFENGIQSLSQRHLSINGFMAPLIEVMILRTNTELDAVNSPAQSHYTVPLGTFLNTNHFEGTTRLE